jgi:NAD(P)-dependent dehydrogenase (short-subunit alcohol dehydrogenase family)
MADVLVTGCSSGFGFLTALEFARQGDRVFAGVRSQTNTLRDAAAAEGLELTVLDLDVNMPDSVTAAVDAVLGISGGIDIAVNNAGIAALASVEDTTVDAARKMMETNFFGPLRVIQAVLPAMRIRGSGHIINVSSVNGIVGAPFSGAYSASKAALESLSEALAAEVGPLGISVSVIQPGAFHTAIDEKLQSVPTSALFPGVAEVVASMRNAGASDRPQEVANAIVEIAKSPSPPFRIQVGADCQRIYAARREMDDATFASNLLSLFSST